MNENEKNQEFIKEQYSQYWEMIRFHLNLSWQVPALTLVAVIAFIGFDPDKLTKWLGVPLVPAVTLLVVGLFVGVMFIHHRRNLLFVSIYERAVVDFEKNYGLEAKVHHSQVSPHLKGWQRISSSTSLSVFLFLLAISLLGVSVYFFAIAF